MTKKFIPLFLLLFFLFQLISAGVGSPYTSNNPLEMNYGETKTIEIQLTNKGTIEPTTFKIEIIEGAEVLSLEKTVYTVGADSELFIPLTISIPNDYSPQVQRVNIAVTPDVSNQGGMVSLGTAYTVEFDVILSQAEEQTEGSSSSLWLIILILAIIVVIIFIFVIKRRR